MNVKITRSVLRTLPVNKFVAPIVFTSMGRRKKYYDTFTDRGIPLVLIDRKMEGSSPLR